jgi:uncharacterized SAM-binding protein YcdF (DUF218 family)
MTPSTPEAGSRNLVISAVTTPLAFLVLALLVVETLLGGMAAAFKEERTLLIWVIVVFLAVFIFAVVGLAIWRPEALSGSRPWQPTLAQRLADDLVMSLDGAFTNLGSRSQEQAWETVADVITYDRSVNKEYLEFCVIVANRLRKQNEVRRIGREQEGAKLLRTTNSDD